MEQQILLLLDTHAEDHFGQNLEALRAALSQEGLVVQQTRFSFDGGDKERELISEHVAAHNPAVVLFILPARFLRRAGDILPLLLGRLPGLPLIVVSDVCEPDEILNLLNRGAADFLVPPIEPAEVLTRLRKFLVRSPDEAELGRSLRDKIKLEQMIGESRAFTTAVKKLPIIARYDVTVLIAGETGTGKELCARAIHYLSSRSRGPFIPINCGAIPVELIENELFGHERGAFTGASSSSVGLIKEAEGGTIFFDEIDCLPVQAQVKLLRFLQEREYRPLGSVNVRMADVRVVAATNADLDRLVTEGKFRQDLYYRLNIIPMALPPLRERKEDIIPLARFFLSKYNQQFRKSVSDLSLFAKQSLIFYHWPGNVRELEHVIERAVALCEGTCIQDADVLLPHSSGTLSAESFKRSKAQVIERFERGYICELLTTCQGNVAKAAQVAKKDRRALWQLIRKHNINVQPYRATGHS